MIQPVALILADGQELLPTKFTGPFSTEEKNITKPCSEVFESPGWSVERVPFYVIRKMCMGVAYNIDTPTPEEQFIIALNGLQKDRQSLPVPQIHFEKKSRWIWDVWPKLGW